MTENPALHKYDVAKGITIYTAFFFTVEYSSFNEIQTFAGFSKLDFLSKNYSKSGQRSLSFLLE